MQSRTPCRTILTRRSRAVRCGSHSTGATGSLLIESRMAVLSLRGPLWNLRTANGGRKWWPLRSQLNQHWHRAACLFNLIDTFGWHSIELFPTRLFRRPCQHLWRYTKMTALLLGVPTFFRTNLPISFTSFSLTGPTLIASDIITASLIPPHSPSVLCIVRRSMKAHCCNLQLSHICSLRSSLILSSDLRTYFQHDLSLVDCRLNRDMYLLFPISVQATCYKPHPTLLHLINEMVRATYITLLIFLHSSSL